MPWEGMDSLQVLARQLKVSLYGLTKGTEYHLLVGKIYTYNAMTTVYALFV
jgi:hypothetical protein